VDDQLIEASEPQDAQVFEAMLRAYKPGAKPEFTVVRGSETLKIARLAAAHGLLVSPHVVHELSLHVAGALSNGFLVELIDWTPPDLFVEMPRCEDGHFQIPDRPGHGIALAPGAERAYRVV
jgi:L-alanine-DL-glutamate epimerase-like enolase superfamily enzyme